jgi:hypothetical protein
VQWRALVAWVLQPLPSFDLADTLKHGHNTPSNKCYVTYVSTTGMIFAPTHADPHIENSRARWLIPRNNKKPAQKKTPPGPGKNPPVCPQVKGWILEVGFGRR